MLEQSMQVEALRLLAAWWDSSRPVLGPWRRRRETAAGWRQGVKAVTGPASATR